MPVNLLHNKKHRNDVEFVLVDFGSEDGLGQWIASNFAAELEEGYLVYHFANGLKTWHASVAKNTSHYYAGGQYLVNLDCDNYTGPQGAEYLLDKFFLYGDKTILHQFSGNPGDGSYGRIGVHRRFFFSVGGYDQSFEPMGYQDLDLILRLQELGLQYRWLKNPVYTSAIPNTKYDSIKFCKSPLDWIEMDRKNARASRFNIASGNLIANNGNFGLRI
ncbi:MAG: glycosyltransferase family 2 protein [Bacteroidetes bacterium]|nr:glycosyltransferase family 2 protein [Bacteroidota bacterium]